MAGVRVQHPTQKNVRFTITDPSIQFDVPYQCTPPEFGGCGQIHTHKTHHLNLDETGSVIIGDVLYQKIRAHLVAFGFVETNVVEKPPTMGVGIGTQAPGSGQWGNIPIVRGGG